MEYVNAEERLDSDSILLTFEYFNLEELLQPFSFYFMPAALL